MRHILTVLAIAGLMLVGFGGINPAAAWWEEASDNEDFVNNAVGPVNDLHITYFNPGHKMRLVAHCDNGFPTFTGVPTGPDSTTWNLTWSGNTVAPLASVHVGATFKVENANALYKQNIYWTFNGAPVGSSPALNGPGFLIQPPFGVTTSVTYRLYNNGPNAMTIRGFQVRQSFSETALCQMLFGQLTGWDPPRSDFVIGPGLFKDITVQTPDNVTTWFLFGQGQVVINDVVVGNFVHQHEHTVITDTPTVTTWGLIALALLMLGVGFAVVRRSRRAVA